MRIEHNFAPLKIHIESKEEKEFLQYVCREHLDKLIGKWYGVSRRDLSDRKQREVHLLQHLIKGLE